MKKEKEKAERELEFYQKISNSPNPEFQQWREVAPNFFGTETFYGENGESCQCLVLGKCCVKTGHRGQ